MPLSKFNFIPAHQIGSSADSAGYQVRLSKTGLIIFSKFTTDVYRLSGKRVLLYGDKANKTIGWKIVEGNTSMPELNQTRLLTPVKASGTIQLSVVKLMKQLGIPLPTESKKFDVKEYESPLISGTIYYIQF